MNIIIDFILENKITNSQVIFWSCQLPSDVEKFSSEFMNSDNEFKIEKYKNFKLLVKYEQSNDENFAEHTKNKANRPVVFLPCNKVKNSGSPFAHCSAELVNWYCDSDKFNAEMSECIGDDISDFEYNDIQIETIETIKKIIGIDIFKNESAPGSFAVYSKLEKFSIANCNFNHKNGQRYQEIIALDGVADSEFLAIVEIIDDFRILYSDLKTFSDSEKFLFPDTDKLEPFSHVHITIHKKIENSFKRVFEYENTLIRSFILNFGIIGNSKRLLKNRYKQGELDEILKKDHFISDSGKEKKDWRTLDVNAKTDLFGFPKEWLESKFFDTTDKGKLEFLGWAENKLSHAKFVTIIDPFFDINGLNDFLTCSSISFDFTLITTNPCVTERELSDRNLAEKNKHLAEYIFAEMPNAKIYFLDRNILHDRYLIISDGTDSKVFSLSNSWNGTVNNYSLFVQEMTFENALKVQDFYKQYQTDDHLQKNDKKKSDKNETREKEKAIYTEQLAEEFLKEINSSAQDSFCIDDFYNVFYELFKCLYYGNVEKDVVENLFREKLKNICFIKSFIEKIVKNLLTKQQKQFSEKGIFRSGDVIDDIESAANIFQRIKNVSLSYIRYFDLCLDYSDFKMLLYCFSYRPDLVIHELKVFEKNNCFLPGVTERDGALKKYSVSETIVTLMLQDMYFYLDEDDEKIQAFVQTAQSTYCKLFFANVVIENNTEIEFQELKVKLERLNLTVDEMELILADLYNVKSISRPNSQIDTNYLSEVEDYAINLFVNNTDILLKFIFAVTVRYSEFNISAKENLLSKIGDEQIKTTYEQLLLLSVLQKVPCKKLYELLLKNSTELTTEKIELITKANDSDSYLEKKASIVDLKEFINYIPYLAHILASRYLAKNKMLINNLVYKINTHKDIIFEIQYIDDIDFDYFILNIVFLALHEIGTDNTNVINEVGKIEWYIPFMLNTLPDDYYGLAILLVDIYLSFINVEKRLSILEKISDRKLESFIASKIMDKFADDAILYDDVLENNDFEKLDAPQKTIFLLNVFAGVILYTSDEKKENVRLAVESIKKKLSSITTQKMIDLLNAGIDCFERYSLETRKKFINALDEVYHQYSLENFALDEGETTNG